MNSSLLLQQCTACLVRLIRMVFEMEGKWLYSCCFSRFCVQDLFNIARSILVQSLSCFFSMRFVSVHMVHLFSSIDTVAAWKKSRFILSDRSDFHIIDCQSIVVHIFAWCILTSLSVDETLLPRFVNLSSNLKGPPLRVKMAPSRLKRMHSVSFAFTWKPMPPSACSRQCPEIRLG